MSIAAQNLMVNEKSLKQMVAAQEVRSVLVLGVRGGWSLLVRYGREESPLVNQRGELRTWVKLDTVARYLRRFGIMHFDVDSSGYESATGRKRPDRANAMAEMHERAGYDRWIRTQVASAVENADQPDSEWVTKEQALERFSDFLVPSDDDQDDLAGHPGPPATGPNAR